jgi:hypothetical protein
MLIPLTNVYGKNTFGVSASTIWVVERDQNNPIITRVVTTMNGPKGLVAYEVMETPEEVIELIAQAAGKPVPSLAGLPASG